MGPVYCITDDRFDYAEPREVAFGLINDRLFVCVFTDREAEAATESGSNEAAKGDVGIVRRVISLRKANRREEEKYGSKLE